MLYSNLFSNFENFIYSSKGRFPRYECLIQNKRESDVYESERFYQVLYIDIRFPKDKMITYARPYICKDKNGEVSFGWIAKGTNEVFGNIENTCQFYNEFVIGFIPVDDSYIENDEKIFEMYKQIIESQYGE